MSKFVLRFVRGVDQHQPTPLRGRQQRAQSFPAIALMHLDVGPARQRAAQRGMLVGVQLTGHKHIVGAQSVGDERGRSGIGAQLFAQIEGAQRLQIARNQRRRLAPANQARDALAPFGAAQGFFAQEIVGPAPGMCVEDCERRVFAPKHMETEEKHGVLQHVGVVAGMERMAIIHAPGLAGAARQRQMDCMSLFRDNETARRYELDHDGGPSLAEYRDQGLVRFITHVETPEKARGKGYAAQLMAGVVESARAAGLKLQPRCSYALAYFQRHTDAADVLA